MKTDPPEAIKTEFETMKNAMMILAASAALALAATAPVRAAEAAPKTATQAATVLTAGEVRKVDPAQGKITIRHETITNLDMPAMTMIFRAQKPELLKDVKAGDRIRFHAEMDKGILTVTRIEPAK